jgi:hypothetical protein
MLFEEGEGVCSSSIARGDGGAGVSEFWFGVVAGAGGLFGLQIGMLLLISR